MIRFIDLFAGTGGIRLGFQQALDKLQIKYECVKSAEIDLRACETYKSNFNENAFCDVHDLNQIAPFDVLLAGFPCQSFSYAGKQKGFADTRGTLFFEVERIIAKYKPKLCLLENVRGLTTHDNGRTFQTILDKLHKLGYYTEYRLINSSNYGVPQNRVRIYIIASLEPITGLSVLNDVGAKDSHNFDSYIKNNLSLFEENLNNYRIISDILENNPDVKYDCSEEFKQKLLTFTGGDLNKLHGARLIDSRNGNSIHSWDIGLRGECTENENNLLSLLVVNRRKHIFGTHQDGKALTLEQIKTFYSNSDIHDVIKSLLDKKYLRCNDGKYNLVCGNMSFEVFKFLDPKSISITLTASDSHKLGIFYNNRLRRLTPRECARLQGYPDDYKLHPIDTVAYKQLGNAVTVPVIKELTLDYFNNNELFFEPVATKRNIVITQHLSIAS